MGTVRKFTFDLDFDAPEEPETPEPEAEDEEPEEEIPTFSEEEVAEARSEGFDAGKEEGRREAADATEQKLLETLEAACEKLGEVYNTQTEANREIGREMISVATAIARKMFPDLNARNALGEVERVVQETLKAVTEEPRIQIMVNPELREPLTERLGTMTHRAGFEGKVFVNPDPAMPLGDCRIEWSNGAAVRNVEEMWEMIDKIIEENLHDAHDDELDDGEEASTASVDATPEAVETEPDETARAEPDLQDTDDAEPAFDSQASDDLEPESGMTAEAEPESGDIGAAVTDDPEISDPEPAAAPDEMSEIVEPDGTESPSDAPEFAPDIGATDASDPDGPPSGPGVDAEQVDANETPSWQAAVGESTGVHAPIEPPPAPEPDTTAGADVSEEEPDPAELGAHGPSFAPTVDAADDSTDLENTETSQDFSMEEREAPIPHVEDESTGAEGESADAEPASPPLSDPDPVSPATQAAILDAQGALDDGDENPSGG